MQLIDDRTKEIVGQLADISSGGFKLDIQNPIPVIRIFDLERRLRDFE